MRTMFLLLGLSLFACFLTGCATPYSVYQDERKFDRYVDDEALALNVKTHLMHQNFTEGFDVSVYAYRGHVYLVGIAPQKFRAKALQIARDYPGTKAVTAHWFDKAGSFANNAALEMRLSGALIDARNVPSTQVELDVNNGHVVVLGLVANKDTADRIIRVIRGVEGVKGVTSYIHLPPAKPTPARPKTEEPVTL